MCIALACNGAPIDVSSAAAHRIGNRSNRSVSAVADITQREKNLRGVVDLLRSRARVEEESVDPALDAALQTSDEVRKCKVEKWRSG